MYETEYVCSAVSDSHHRHCLTTLSLVFLVLYFYACTVCYWGATYIGKCSIHEIILVLYIPHCLHWPDPKIRSEYQWSVSLNFNNVYLLWAVTKYEVTSTSCSSVSGISLGHSASLLAMVTNSRYSNATFYAKSYIDLNHLCPIYSCIHIHIMMCTLVHLLI